MAVPVSITDSYDALLSTTLANWATTLEDAIATSNKLFYALKKSGAYQLVGNVGDRCKFPVMYELGSADVYSGYDTLDTTPADGLTTAYYEWCQMSKSITISRREERQNAGSEVQILDLLKAKTQQSMASIQDLFGKAILQGNGPNSATAITTAYTSSTNGATFVEPIPLLVEYSPTSTSGGINSTNYAWWKNQTSTSSASTFVGFEQELRGLFNKCSYGTGGSPNFHVADHLTFELYDAALSNRHRNPSYTKGDLPFDSLAFKGEPLVWDEFVPDVANGTVTSIPVSSSGTWYMFNLGCLGMKVDKETNFVTTDFRKPDNQDAKTAHILWLGSLGTSNRRKQGVLGSVDTTIVA